MASTRRDWVLRFSASPEFLEVDPEAAVAVDGGGKIIGMTSGARCALDPDGSGHLIGSQLQDWLEISVDDMPEFMRGRPSEDRVLHLKDGARALWSCRCATDATDDGSSPAQTRTGSAWCPWQLCGAGCGPSATFEQGCPSCADKSAAFTDR